MQFWPGSCSFILSSAPSVCCSPNVRDHILHPCKTAGSLVSLNNWIHHSIIVWLPEISCDYFSGNECKRAVSLSNHRPIQWLALKSETVITHWPASGFHFSVSAEKRWMVTICMCSNFKACLQTHVFILATQRQNSSKSEFCYSVGRKIFPKM
jgi:hypothetical protein